MKSFVKIAFLQFIISFTIISCEKDKGPVVLKPNTPGDTVINFADDIQPFFDTYCVECHNQSHPFLDLRNFYSYNDLLFTGANAPYVDSLNPTQSYIIRRLQGNGYPKMPPNPPMPSDGMIDTVIIWIRQGAHNN